VDNYFLLALLLWPAAILVAALLNMLVWWTFSWGELVMAYLVGVAIGSIAFVGLGGTPSAATGFFLMMSQGVPGVLRWRGGLSDPAIFFWVGAGSTVGAVLVAALLDRVTLAIDKEMTAGGVAVSVLTFPFKAPFCLVTSAAGLLIWLAGVVRSFFGTDGRIGFLGGILYAEWDRGDTNGEWTTTIGCTVQCWKNKFSGVIQHELYHTRQCIYFHDFMIPAWLVGELVRLIASRTANRDNPIERAAYVIDDHMTGTPATPATP
jgi:hypothetical protein